MDPSSIITNVLGQLGNLAVSKAKELMSVRDQVMAWKLELELIQGKLEDLEFKPDKGKEAETWMCQLREVASKMSQVIDAYNSEIENTKPKGFRKLKFWEKPLQLNALSADITSIRQSLETLHRYDLNNMMNRRPHNPAEVDDPDIVGFDSAKSQIISHLLDKSISRRTALSIVGIGGLGKNTLAKKVYNSYDLKGNFDCRAWQEISQTFDQYNILRKILYSNKPEMENIKPPLDDMYMASEIKRCLSNKRHLIILDDVWSKDLWDGLKKALPDSDKGSRVIITTREVDVARAADRTNVCQLGFLTEDESVALVFSTTLQRPDIQLQNYPPNLKDITQKLIKKCGGLPLELIVLGGISQLKNMSQLLHGTVGKCNSEVSNPSINPNSAKQDSSRQGNPKGVEKHVAMIDTKLKGVKVKCPEMRACEKKKPGSVNPSKFSPKKPKAKDLKRIPRDKVRGNKKVIPKASMPKGVLTRQETSEAWEPKSKKPSTEKDSRNEKPRLNHFEIGECSESKDEMGKYIEESEVSETEELEMMSERETLRRMKRKSKTKEKTY